MWLKEYGRSIVQVTVIKVCPLNSNYYVKVSNPGALASQYLINLLIIAIESFSC
jgi:hypothetical protein